LPWVHHSLQVSLLEGKAETGSYCFRQGIKTVKWYRWTAIVSKTVTHYVTHKIYSVLQVGINHCREHQCTLPCQSSQQ
jgi:hypothetical protein